MRKILSIFFIFLLCNSVNAQTRIGTTDAVVLSDHDLLSQQKKNIAAICNHLLPQMINIETPNPTGAIKEMRSLRDALSEAQKVNARSGGKVDLTRMPHGKPDAPFKSTGRSVFTTPEQYNEYYWICEQAKEP